MNGVEVLLTPASAPGSMTETLEASVALWTAGSSPATRNKAVESTIPFPRNKFGAMLTVCSEQPLGSYLLCVNSIATL